MNVQSLNEVLIWVSWFTAIAFLLLLTKLSKDRFEFLSFSPNTPMFYHWKVRKNILIVMLYLNTYNVIFVFIIFQDTKAHKL